MYINVFLKLPKKNMKKNLKQLLCIEFALNYLFNSGILKKGQVILLYGKIRYNFRMIN
jgi:hypothetical protein